MVRPILLICMVVFCVSVCTLAKAGEAQEVLPGNSDRKLILDAMRPAMEWEMQGPVEFTSVTIHVKDGWASVSCEPQRPGGAKIDVSKTVHAAHASFMDGLTTYAFLQFRSNRWNLIGLMVGPSDAAQSNYQSPEIPDELTIGRRSD